MGREKAIGREARLQWLSRTLAMSGACRLTEAAEALGCSAMTVRRDLAGAASMFSMLGGYIVPTAANPYRIDRESDVHVAAKKAIADRAILSLRPGDAIFLDCGSTIPHLARRLPSGLRLTIVTYALNVANALSANRDVELALLGGIYRSPSDSFEVDDPRRALSRFGLAAAFLSAGGLHVGRGASCSHFHEVKVKRAAMAAAQRRWLLTDASKFGSVKPAAFAELSEFDAVITAPSPAAGPEVAALGERLIVAETIV